MKILLSAIGCNPYDGSENYCGWSFALAMRKYHDVTVLTRSVNRPAIERYCAEYGIGDLRFLYCDVPDVAGLRHSGGIRFFLYLILWERAAFRMAKKLHARERFDVIHHVTLGDFRMIGSMWKLDAKFVCGPLGGAQLTPKALETYVRGHRREETFRKWMNIVIRYHPLYIRALRNTRLIYAANEETLDFLKGAVSGKTRCVLMTENGIGSDYLAAGETVRKPEKKNESVTVVWAGRMVYRKGLRLLLEAVGRIGGGAHPFSVRLYGEGPEQAGLEEMCGELGLRDRVFFCGSVPYGGMREIYAQADVFVFPSLRETTGTVLFEAMANKLPVVALNQNGARLIVENDCGILVDPNDPRGVVQGLADALRDLIENSEKRLAMGERAFQKLAERYTWEAKAAATAEMYGRL